MVKNEWSNDIVKIGILTDSTANIQQIPYASDRIKVIDFSVIISGESFKASSLSADEFYQRMANAEKIPTTSQGTVMDVITLLEGFKVAGFTDVIVMTISSKLSGSYQNIASAASEVDGIQVHLPDTKTTEIMLGTAVKYVDGLIEQGHDVHAVLHLLEPFLHADGAFFYVDSLKHLVKGGRISGASGMVGEVLKIKPILELTIDGTIELKEKKRTKSKAIDHLISLYQEKVKDTPHTMFLLYSDNPDEVATYESAFPIDSLRKERYLSPLTPVVGAHTGPGVIGIGWRLHERA
jgi:DegV family protein with EDD domain